ncbi:single-stranded-DNA-specific exonuclease RecJ [Sporosarcina sp. NCCP-2222]|uniref:single-stranded-DNA-specific exonuclease RecJ n=1 Tax=Sporosarcina sp. NCCP-2222 TaxID=2935073 RepID=UPI002085F547|nr:single-stranded-DNA-specific exonuclease RecJ [Sporosarcina sp. NCCP-2222]GKV54390.1 single-stranded-DNA-specific exonuclease RecJ [Sporosarcina sp. NCCP-2222]
MIESMKNWKVRRPDDKIVKTLMDDLGLPSIHAKILASRGLTEAKEVQSFLHMNQDSLHDPFLLYDMDKAVERIQKAIANQEKIVVYGDYDADGVTSVTVMTTAIERLGGDVAFAIPDRFKHGYGPNKELFQELSEAGAKLIITVDNGISGIEQIAFAKSLGMDIIVTDHHEIGVQLPEADAIIHPRHPEGNYPFGELAGVGVAFKVATALLGEVPVDLLEIAAIGTVADLVPLRDENRFIVKEGIRRMRHTGRPAIQALSKVSSTEQAAITEETIGFGIGPRLNAPGRLGSAAPAVQLLKSEDMMEASTLAEELDALNKERQALVSMITEQANEMMETMYGDMLPYVIVLDGEGWNPGVVGIVASRMTEKYYRPSIILSVDRETGMAKGSARSIEGFDLYKELSKCADLLPHFGGHQMAAGMTLPAEDVETLRERLNEQGKRTLSDELLMPKLHIDVPIKLDEIEVDIIDSMETLRPFGMSFEKPVFLLEDVSVTSIRKIGASKDHLKMEVEEGGLKLDAIGFGLGALADDMSPAVKLSLTGDLQVNEWNGRKKPQLLLGDVRCDERQVFDLRGMREVSRWLPAVPKKATAFVAFYESTAHSYQPYMPEETIYCFGRDDIPDMDNLVLLDLPNGAEPVETLLNELNPKRIYAHFHVTESKYFEGIPDRAHFGWYYSFLKKRGSLHLKEQAPQLSKHKGWKIETIYFMTKVFFELGFVKIEDGVVFVCEPSSKRNLNEAPAYKERERQIEMERMLLYAPYMELKRWFDSLQHVQKV